MRGTIWLAVTPADAGPLGVGAWLQQHAGVETRVVSVLALPPAARLARSSVELLRDELALQLARHIGTYGQGLQVTDTEILVGSTVEEALVADAERSGDVLVVGRRARRDDVGLVRLGRVTRRVLRNLPGPTIVAPPDLRPADVGNGPVLVAVRPSPDARGALHFGIELARAAKRSVVLAHVLDPLDLGWSVADARTVAQVREAAIDADRAALRSFLAEESADHLEVRTVERATVEGVLEIAAVVDPCFIVCGSRRLSTGQRIFNTSVGSTLAAVSPVPVVVVPSTP